MHADIAGPGGPNDQAGVIVNTRDAVRLHDVAVASISRPDERLIALMLSGFVNDGGEPSRAMFLLNGDGAATVVSQIIGLVRRAGGEIEAEFDKGMDERA